MSGRRESLGPCFYPKILTVLHDLRRPTDTEMISRHTRLIHLNHPPSSVLPVLDCTWAFPPQARQRLRFSRQRQRNVGTKAVLNDIAGNSKSDHEAWRFKDTNPSETNKEQALVNSGSTLTNSEIKIFERIYEDFLRNISKRKEKTLVTSLSEEPTQNLPSSGNESLESMFQYSVPTSESLDKSSDNEAFQSGDQFQLSLGKQEPMGDTILSKSQADTPRIEMARVEDWKSFNNELAATKSDVDVWNVLQRRVFRRVRDFTYAIQKTIQERAVLDHDMQDSTRQTRTKHRNESFNYRLAMSHNNPIWNQDPEVFNQLYILRTNLAQQCAACVQNLRKRFPRSPYALAVLPRIKSYGPISYALGVSTELYNELLYIHWVCHRDLHGCANLVTEMLDRSVTSDARTRAIFNDALQERVHASEIWSAMDSVSKHRRGKSIPVQSTAADRLTSPSAATWWFLQSSESGWERWHRAEKQIVQIEQQRRTATSVLPEIDDFCDELKDVGEPSIRLAAPRSIGREKSLAPQMAATGNLI